MRFGSDNLMRWVTCLVAASLLSTGWFRPECECCSSRLEVADDAVPVATAPPACCTHEAAPASVAVIHPTVGDDDAGRPGSDPQSCCPCGCPGDCAAMCAPGPLVCPLVALFDASNLRPADAGRLVHAPSNYPPSVDPDGVFHPPRS